MMKELHDLSVNELIQGTENVVSLCHSTQLSIQEKLVLDRNIIKEIINESGGVRKSPDENLTLASFLLDKEQKKFKAQICFI